MKLIDILSDKIDYLFRRSKNADERTYDFFIRTVTFLILALIILCYGSFVHAENSTLLSHFNINTSEVGNWLAWNDLNYDKFNNLRFNTSNVSYPIGSVGQNDIINLVYADGMDLVNNYVFVEDSQYSWFEVWLIPKDLIDNGNIVAKYSGNVVVYDSDQNYTVTRYAIEYSQQTDPTKYLITNQTITQGYGFYAGSLEPWTPYHTVFSNAPVYNLPNMNTHESIRTWVSGGMEEDYSTYLMNNNYYNYDTDLLEQPWDNITPVEGANNHLYLEDFQIGLSATTNLADLMSSDVIIGISGDDYIQNHPDEFEIWIDYHVMLKDSITGISDPDVHYSYYYPARTFLNGVYSMGINEIFEHMTLSNNSSLYSYYRNLKDTYNQKVVADGQTFVRGLFPDLYKTLWEHYIGGYYVDNAVTTNNTIFNFDFEVSVAIRESGSNNISGIGTKKFDFLNGTESITTASVLQNHDPWEGKSDPQMSPAVPSTGSSISSSSGGGGSVNVKVDVSGQKIPLGVKTKAQMEEILKNYRDVYGEFDSNWYTLADQNDDNNFLKILGLTLPEIPAIDYMVQCACVIFGLAVILFVLKVLLF